MFDIEMLKEAANSNEFCAVYSEGEFNTAAENARDLILAYTNRSLDKWLPVFDGVAVRLALAILGKTGAEGVRSRSEGAVRTDFEQYKEFITPFLSGYRLVNVR